MPRRRPSAPTTPLGAWLEAWLAEHQDWTHQALAEDLGVSKGVISQWTSGAVKKVTQPNLIALARVTGEPLENLERMVYGREMRSGGGGTRVGEAPGRYFTDAELQALLERAADVAVRRLMDELGPDRGA